jgi:hypothetical protein
LFALKLEMGVERHRVARSERVDLNRVIDDELHWLQRVDPLRIATELFHRVAHGRQVDDRGHPGEVLQQHTSGRERDLARGLSFRVDRGECLDVLAANGHTIFGAEQVFEENFERVRQRLGLRVRRVHGRQSKVRIRGPADGQNGLGGERIGHG